jgi:mannose-1-phosphate guanylyltransferase
VLTDVDLGAVVRRHESEGAQATILLTPVPNPSAYGLVETDGAGRVRRFLEKPRPEQITTNQINAGIYVLESAVLGMMAPGVNLSIERYFFPALLERGDKVLGPVHRGYWIDIGTPEKYLQVHRDILNRRFPVPLQGEPRAEGFVHRDARVADDALLDGHFYVGPGCDVAGGARIGPDAVLVADVRVEPGAHVRDSVLWRGATVGADCHVESSLVGPGVRLGRSSVVRNAALGEGSLVSEYSRTL